jgi:transketolase
MLEKEEVMNPNAIRKKIIELVVMSREGHVASSFSIVELLIAIFADMKRKRGYYLPQDLILSKGHASYAYYGTLHILGMMDEQELATVGKLGSKFYGHLPFISNDNRFAYGSGSLGHGLPYAVGAAVANKLSNSTAEIYCLIGDGEANEGTFWESLLLVEKYENLKLNILVDCNGSSERAIPIQAQLEKLVGVFKFIEVLSCDGHNLDDLHYALVTGKDTRLILCKTIKGHPSTMMKNNPSWHHRVPNEIETQKIFQELK